jgi:endonuclease-3 related protein
MDPKIILDIDQDKLANAIRPSGYYNQKAKRIKILTQFLLDGRYLKDGYIPDRDGLLGLWGIGEETADSILLYAFKVPVFVIDAYTRRIFKRLGVLAGGEKYKIIASIFTDCLEEDFVLYQEYHALIVRHVKAHCQKKPLCDGCVLNEICRETDLVKTIKKQRFV